MIFLSFGFLLALSIQRGELFRRQGREHHVIAVHDDHAPGLASAGDVDDATVILGILNQTLDGSRIGANQSDNAFCCDHVSIADVDKFHGNLHSAAGGGTNTV